ncbi:hypothetical protein AHAT_41850 [Agarivorans sp. Toyoura001]|uniref:hypothetical protein n=1 Tax=Agarivorans sp. Toyoura001 TaxID=2283141 RepID=UPI0010EB175A|nr:hypothetical protein [Agarivorans sp. Toyoura001]GDY28295.1 hypothetical protein AHAT_41850 [Agarivorans sp. Toyoura001]
MGKCRNVEFWNFICHFGENKQLDLIDHLDTIIIPAFLNKNLTRRWGEHTTWRFHEVSFVQHEFDNETNFFLHGHLIKDTNLERSRFYDNGELIEDPKSIKTAPISTFILSLSDHRLFYIRDSADSPDMAAFKATIFKFIKATTNELINEDYGRAIEEWKYQGKSNRKPLKKNIKSRYPECSLEITALSSDASIDEFIRSMKRINKLSYTLIVPNGELNHSGLFEQLQDTQTNTGNYKTTLTYSTGNKEKSLEHNGVSQLTKNALKTQNVEVAIKGIDIHGSEIQGTNDELVLKKPLGEIEDSYTALTYRVYDMFRKLIVDGIITKPIITNKAKTMERISHVVRRFTR